MNISSLSVTEINKLLLELQEAKNNLLREDNLKTEERIRKLDWCKDVSARLDVNEHWSMGTPKYTIILIGECPKHSKIVRVMGDNKLEDFNILYSADIGFERFYTSSADLLYTFLHKVQFKHFTYDTPTALIFEKIKEKYAG